jgi:hypothetical protein
LNLVTSNSDENNDWVAPDRYVRAYWRDGAWPIFFQFTFPAHDRKKLADNDSGSEYGLLAPHRAVARNPTGSPEVPILF